MKFDWGKIYKLPRITTINTYLRSFQYKILKNILFLNKKLFVFAWKMHHYARSIMKKIPLHIFSECTYLIYFGNS